MIATYLDHLKLDLVVPVVLTAADCFDNGVDEEARPLAVQSRRLLALLVETVVWAVPIEQIIAEELLNAVEQLLHQARQLALNRHLEDVEVFVGAWLFEIAILVDLLCSRDQT